jgi:hypothetical protein
MTITPPKADAALIAAAPDLLAALKAVCSTMTGGTIGFSADHPVALQVRAAISKAESTN